MCEVNLPIDTKDKLTYSVRALSGAFNPNPKLWATDAKYVGQVATLSSPRMDSNTTVNANIVLTDKFAQKIKSGELRSSERDAVKAYPKENFYWRIQKVDSTMILRSNAPQGLNVTIILVHIHLPESGIEVPRWIGNFSYHFDILGRAELEQIIPKRYEHSH